MRWVLGEQSARQLRGARMDDVIFAGNASRRPLGLAEVTLTFDNSDGALSAPFSEIAITRRAYRTGESEFFINKTAVRLRDITDMLLGTGLAAELAAIVSQGEIDAILSAKPEARRELFEGVAGTARYRARKREAQRRIEQTAANALRVNDLLTELEKQLPAIEQQVRRAKRYQKVQQQLRDLEIFSYVHKAKERREERARISQVLGVDEKEAAKEARTHAELASAVNRARDEEYQASLALDDRNAAHARSASQLQTHASAHAAMQAKATELTRASEALEREADAGAQAVAQADTRLSNAIEDLRRSRELRDEALTLAESAAAEEAEETAHWERAYAALRAVEDSRLRASAKSTESNSAAAAAQAEVERLADALSRLDADLQTAHAALDGCGERSKRANAEVERLAADAGKLDQKLQTVAAQANRAIEAVEQQRAVQQAAHASLTQINAKLDALTQFVADLSGAPAGTRHLLDAKAASRLAGVIGTVASQITVDERHATAIDALLGARAHDVIVRTLADAKAAMLILKEKQAGRATIIVLEALSDGRFSNRPLQEPKAAGKSGDIGRASELVRCDASVKPAIEQILGDSFVVANLESAFDCAKEAPHAAFATPEGDVIHGSVITSGSGTGVMSAQAASETLESERAIQSKAAREADAALDRATQTATAGQSQFERIKADIVELTLRQHDAQALCSQLEREREALEQQLSVLRTGRGEVVQRSAQVKESAARHRDTARELAGQLQTLESQRSQALSASDELSKRLGAVRAKHRSAAAQAAALVERVAQLGDDVELARADIERAKGQRKERVTSLARMRDELEQSRADVQRLAALKADAEQAVAEVALRLGELREHRDAALHRTRELEETYAQEEQRGREQSLELERQRIRLAEIDAELALLQQTFSQNPASQQECDDVAARYADFEGDVDAQVRRLREEMLRLGNVNLNALEDRAATLERCEFLREQLRDLEAARANIVASIAEMDAESLRQFNETFAKVSVAFSETFTRLFNGGSAKMWVCEAEDPTEAGIEISAQPPGKKMQNLNLLSGGERALTAVALIFATLQVRPSPFYIFDEIDAALDEANIGRFGVQLADLAGNGRSQIIIITHNKATMTLVDRMYGVTMSEPGISNILSLSLERAGAAG